MERDYSKLSYRSRISGGGKLLNPVLVFYPLENPKYGVGGARARFSFW